MTPFLKLPATSKADVITLRDVLYNDILRLFVFALVLLTLFYGVGALVAAAGNNKYPIEYYTQLFFDYTPVVRLIIPLGFCIAVMGLNEISGGGRVWRRRVYHYDTPQLTRPALGAYITLAIASLLMLIPLSWTSWFWW